MLIKNISRLFKIFETKFTLSKIKLQQAMSTTAEIKVLLEVFLHITFFLSMVIGLFLGANFKITGK